MQTRLVLPSLLVAAIACGSAVAQTPPEQAGSETATFHAPTGPVIVRSVQPPLSNASDYSDTVADLDTNGDGVVSKHEVPRDHALHFEFKLVDADLNGHINEDELRNWQ